MCVIARDYHCVYPEATRKKILDKDSNSAHKIGACMIPARAFQQPTKWKRKPTVHPFRYIYDFPVVYSKGQCPSPSVSRISLIYDEEHRSSLLASHLSGISLLLGALCQLICTLA